VPLLALLTLYEFPFVLLGAKGASTISGTPALIAIIHQVLALGTDAVNTYPETLRLF
jgi:hypothetical protein